MQVAVNMFFYTVNNDTVTPLPYTLLNSFVFGQLLAELAEKKPVGAQASIPEKQQKFREAIKSWNLLDKPVALVESPVDVETVEEPDSRPTSTPAERIAKAKSYKKSKWLLPVSIAASLFILSGIIGWLAYSANQLEITGVVSPPTVKKVPERLPENPPPQIKEPDLTRVRLVQNLVDDDDQSIWETPTTGLPLDFSYVPATPKLIFVLRPAEMWEKEEGKLLFNSLGPVLQQRIDDWTTEIGMEFQDIEQVVMSLHSGEDSSYEPFFVVRLTDRASPETLAETWKNPSSVEIDENHTILEGSGNRSYYVVPTADDETTTRFLYGETGRIREVLESGGANVLSGTMNKLSVWTDSDRHFSLLFLRPALFNEQGQSLMSGPMSGFNRQLDLFLQDEIRGGLLSFHLDEGTYLEMVFDQTVDLKSVDLKESLEKRLREQRDELTRFVSTVPASEYWDKVRLKYDNMLSDVYRNLRWDVEYKTVIGNCWLPPMAGHNLIAASELLMAFSKGAASDATPVATKPIPETIEALLATKRSLDVSTNPDLNILLRGIESEVIDDYGKLPFPFSIRLVGNDLQKEGITQNQRPGDFKMDDKALADILTEIMVRCNPDKDITGPNDPNCKLVWAIGPSPDDADKNIILITTREGAANKGLALPEAFRSE